MVKLSRDNMNTQLSELWAELLKQLGFKLARKGEVILDDHDRKIMKWSGINETQLMRTYRYGEEETPQKFVLIEGTYRITIVLRRESEKKESYQLVSCWLSKNWK